MDKSKRKLAKALGSVGTGAMIWKSPVVDSVVLPAHAEQSGGSCVGSCGGMSNSGPCYCDDLCVGFGDCCFDACSECGQCSGSSAAAVDQEYYNQTHDENGFRLPQ